MTASWLAQMAWEVWVLVEVPRSAFSERGAWRAPRPAAPAHARISVAELQQRLADGAHDLAILDFTTSANYRKAHIPGAWFVLRSQLAQALQQIPPVPSYVFTCASSALAEYAAAEVAALVDGAEVFVLDGGNAAWLAAGGAHETGETRLASPTIDRYRRPYEGTDNPREAMQAYLDWEFGLVEQLGRDGTHGFKVL